MLFPRDKYITKAKELEHSNDFIERTVQYAQNLTQKELPVIFSTKHLAIKLGIKFSRLNYLIENRYQYYEHFEIRKKNGGTRMISSPSHELKIIQSWILQNILSKIKIHDACNSYQHEKSILTNASPHKGADVVLRIDLFKFFDTVTEKRIYGMFESFGYHSNLAVDLAALCTLPATDEYWTFFNEKQKNRLLLIKDLQPILPQGAPTSPALSNLVGRRLDKRLSGLANKHKLKYSRYADDLVLSGNRNDMPSTHLIYRIIKSEGFSPNYKKTKVMRKGTRQIITGLTVSDGIHVPKKFKKQIFRILHFCEKYGASNYQRQSFAKDKAYFREWLLGKIFYIRSIDKLTGDKLLERFNRLTWEV